MVPDGNSNSARSILLSSSSFSCSSLKNVPSPGGRIKAICGEMAGCRNRKDQSAKLLSLSALAPADAGPNPRGAWGWHAAHARSPQCPRARTPQGGAESPPAFPLPKSSSWRAPPCPGRLLAHRQGPKAGGRSQTGSRAAALAQDGVRFLL